MIRTEVASRFLGEATSAGDGVVGRAGHVERAPRLLFTPRTRGYLGRWLGRGPRRARSCA